MKLLHVDSSILGAHSISRQLSAEIVAKVCQGTPDLEITYRDLAAEPVPHLSGSTFAASAAGIWAAERGSGTRSCAQRQSSR
jgi:FMN-dependent NADH-azoreductase